MPDRRPDKATAPDATTPGAKDGGRGTGATLDEAGRRGQILLAAEAVLAAKGSAITMADVARQAHASKETLYGWFGDKEGLLKALIDDNAGQLAHALRNALPARHGGSAGPASATGEVLERIATGLQRLLLGDRSVVINRAAIAAAGRETGLAAFLAEAERDVTLPLLSQYLAGETDAGRLACPDPDAAAEVLVGLVLSDRQTRRLLGGLAAPDEAAIAARSRRAAAQFLRLYAPAAA